MNALKLPSLTSLVINVQSLESGLSAQHTFSESGGSIGSSTSMDWYLTDINKEISSEHCKIVVLDGAYCLKDISGNTYINGAHHPLGKGQLVRLNHKDEISIGPYQLRVLFGSGNEIEEQYGTIDSLFTSQCEDFLADIAFEIKSGVEKDVVDVDPLNALDELLDSTALNKNRLIESYSNQTSQKQQSLVPEDDLGLKKLVSTPQSDCDYKMTSSIYVKKILGFGLEKFKYPQKSESAVSSIPNQQTQLCNSDSNVSEGLIMDEKVLDLLEEEVAKSIQPRTEVYNHNNVQSNHLITGPILEGLGVDLTNEHNMAEMHLLSQEIGESLQACVRGLLALHQQVSEGHFGTLNRNLQPIEDNPLRLGLSYEDTIKTLYEADKSLVHLSAPSAIAESLKTVRFHNEAMQFAITDALSQILNAFSPEVMLRRFNHYKRSTDTIKASTDEWAWEMYCNYYKELTSNRQSGFEKLFWEIFEQSYDRKIRERQREL